MKGDTFTVYTGEGFLVFPDYNKMAALILAANYGADVEAEMDVTFRRDDGMTTFHKNATVWINKDWLAVLWYEVPTPEPMGDLYALATNTTNTFVPADREAATHVVIKKP